MIADIEELEEMDASEIHVRRLNAKEVLTPMKGDNFIFPVADGTVKTPGGGRRLKPSTLIREQDNLRGEPDGSFSTPLQDSSRYDGEANKKFFEENQTDSLLQTLFKMTLHEMMRKLK